ncbi:MAG: tRNA (guanosine(46)-N7)-methyltransferase TrmB [Clostridiaceae bacterium]
MRMRHKPWALPEMLQDPKFYLEPYDKQNKWQLEFGNDAPIDLEIGCGKGDFIRELAHRHPERNYIAMDLKNEVLVYALRKINEEGLTNIRVLSVKAEELDRVFGEGEIDQIYINFANPWPKAGHHKRRLTHPRFLALYRLFTKDQSQLEFKTDDEELYVTSLEYFPEAGYEMVYHSDNLPADHPDNIQTEYESKFRSFGMPIYRIDAVKQPITEERLGELLEWKLKSQQKTGRAVWTTYRENRKPNPET